MRGIGVRKIPHCYFVHPCEVGLELRAVSFGDGQLIRIGEG